MSKIQQQLPFSLIWKTKVKCGRQDEKRENYKKLVDVLWEQFLPLSRMRAGKRREETLWNHLPLNPRMKRGLFSTIHYFQNRLIPLLRGYSPSRSQFFSHAPQIKTKRKAPFPFPSSRQKEAVSGSSRCVLQSDHKLQGAGGPSWGWKRAEFLIFFQHEIAEWFLPNSEKKCGVDETHRRTESKPVAQETQLVFPEHEELCTTLYLSIPCQVPHCQSLSPAPPYRIPSKWCSVSYTWDFLSSPWQLHSLKIFFFPQNRTEH